LLGSRGLIGLGLLGKPTTYGQPTISDTIFLITNPSSRCSVILEGMSIFDPTGRAVYDGLVMEQPPDNVGEPD
jgi:hypothetical protein